MSESSKLELSLKSDLRELVRIADIIEQHGDSLGWPMEWIFNTNLALDELITNVVSYGYGDGYDAKDIHVSLTVEDGNLVVVMNDSAKPYNPFEEAPDAPLEQDLEDRPVGGLGVHLVKTLFTRYEYERVGDRNQVTLIYESTF